MSKYPNSGSLFKNDRKEKDTHPDYTGQCEVDGKPYYMSAWLKEGRSGKFFSFSFKAKDGGSVSKPKQRQDSGTGFDGLDDDIPF